MFTTVRPNDGFAATTPAFRPVVARLQRALGAAGFETEPDGLCGRRTVRAIWRFQRSRALARDGVAGASTWAALQQYLDPRDAELESLGYPTLSAGRGRGAVLFHVTAGWEQNRDVVAALHGGAVHVLRARGVPSDITWQDDELREVLSAYARHYKRVLLVAHGVEPLPGARPIADHVLAVGPVWLEKPRQFAFLRGAGFPVADWMVSPASWEEVFETLGDSVVGKPRFGGGARGVRFYERSATPSGPPPQDRVWCSYVGAGERPFWTARINALFGRPIVAYVRRGRSRILSIGNSRIAKEVPPEVMALGLRACSALTQRFGCAVVGLDITGNEDGCFILEANMNSVGFTAARAFTGHTMYRAIADACEAELLASSSGWAATPAR